VRSFKNKFPEITILQGIELSIFLPFCIDFITVKQRQLAAYDKERRTNCAYYDCAYHDCATFMLTIFHQMCGGASCRAPFL